MNLSKGGLKYFIVFFLTYNFIYRLSRKPGSFGNYLFKDKYYLKHACASCVRVEFDLQLFSKPFWI